MADQWRTNPLPKDWAKRRQACKAAADGRCQAIGRDGRCTEQGNEAHHPNPADHDNLVWLCSWHHMRITAIQAAEGRARKGQLTEKRPGEKHPGLR